MPALPSSALPIDILLDRSAITTNFSNNAVKVVCAWPLSGQYGPGTRFLYYALISACFFGRDVEWLKAACLAAALLFPAVAALHGIVIGAVHVDGAVDMDVYGAFQVCSIGILLAPVTVMLSRRYFEHPGSSIIIMWTALILAGLMSLVVEFYRTNAIPCTDDGTGHPIPTRISDFPYGTTCGLVCSVDTGPYSPMRGGSANNIYVIPAPDKLTFNASTLIAAACCVPAILLLISNWNKIREINLKAKLLQAKLSLDAEAKTRTELDDSNNLRPRTGCEVEDTSGQPTDGHAAQDGTYQCTCSGNEAEHPNNRRTRNIVATPLFGAATLSILIMGEWNFFSPQVRYQTEPIASIGQWAPIVGTGLALLGSLYVLLLKTISSAKRQDKAKHGEKDPEEERQERMSSAAEYHQAHSRTKPILPNLTSVDNFKCCKCGGALTTSDQSNKGQSRGHKVMQTLAHWRHRGGRAMIVVFEYIGTAAEDTFENSGFKHAKEKWIQYPGEKFKNPALPLTVDQFRRSREFSRTSDHIASMSGGIESTRDMETASARSFQSQDSAPSPRPRSLLARLDTATTASNSTFPDGEILSGVPGRRGTSETLQVPSLPSPIYRGPTRESLASVSPISELIIVRGGRDTPSLVVPDDSDIPLSSRQAQFLRSETRPLPSTRTSRPWRFHRRHGTM